MLDHASSTVAVADKIGAFDVAAAAAAAESEDNDSDNDDDGGMTVEGITQISSASEVPHSIDSAMSSVVDVEFIMVKHSFWIMDSFSYFIFHIHCRLPPPATTDAIPAKISWKSPVCTDCVGCGTSSSVRSPQFNGGGEPAI